MVKAVFFDFYDTLCTWGQPLIVRLQKIADRYGFEIDAARYAAARENLYAEASGSDPTTHALLETMQEIIESYYEFVKALGVQEHVEQMTWELLQSEHSLFAANAATLYEDTVPTLQHLRDVGLRLAIVSNWDTPLDPLTERLGIAHYFDIIVASHDARVRSAKPDPHIFNYTLAAIGVSAEERFMLGILTKRTSVGQKMRGSVQYSSTEMAHKPADGHETIRNLSELPALLSGCVCGV